MGFVFWCLLFVAWGGDSSPDGAVVSESVRSGPVRDRVLPSDGADLVLFYTSEHRGQLGPCGCDGSSRGGLARLQAYLQEAERVDAQTPKLIVHGGEWADDALGQDGQLSPMARIRGQFIADALELSGFDVLNGSWRDGLFLEAAEVPVSVVTSSRSDDGLPSFVVLERGGIRIAVLGISAKGSEILLPKGAHWRPPAEAVRVAVEELDGAADLVVVLAHQTGSATREIAMMEEVDVIVESGGFTAQDPPWFQGETVWVRSREEGARVGELRLYLGPDGRVVSVRDRWIDLDGRVPESRAQLRLLRRSERRLIQAASEP